MRVLMFSSLFHPAGSGSEGQARALGRVLIERGHSVTVVTQRLPGLPTAERVDGIDVRRGILRVARGPVHRALYLLSSMLWMERSWKSHDIAHIHHLYLDAFAAGLVWRLRGRPALAKVACGGEVGDLARVRRSLLAPVFLQGLRRLDRVIAVSGQIEDELARHGFPRARIARIPNGVDTKRFRPAADGEAARQALGLSGRVALFVGRLDAQKGLGTLLAGWAGIVRRRGPVSLILLGQGPLETALRARAHDLGIEADVRFAGGVADVRPFLAAADVFVLPSLAEGMSNALLEAMAAGLPCVVTRVGGNVDVVEDGVTGLVIAPDDPEQLAGAIEQILEDCVLAERLGGAARAATVDRFALERVTDRYLELYEALLGGAR